jgi:hypothetical protein
VLVQMTPTELLRSFRRMRRSVPEGLGQWPRPHSLQASASRAGKLAYATPGIGMPSSALARSLPHGLAQLPEVVVA